MSGQPDSVAGWISILGIAGYFLIGHQPAFSVPLNTIGQEGTSCPADSSQHSSAFQPECLFSLPHTC